MSIFRKRRKGSDSEDTAVQMIVGDKVQNISYNQLCLSNNFSQKAVVNILIRKGIITEEEYVAELKRIRDGQMEMRKRFRGDDKEKR